MQRPIICTQSFNRNPTNVVGAREPESVEEIRRSEEGGFGYCYNIPRDYSYKIPNFVYIRMWWELRSHKCGTKATYSHGTTANDTDRSLF